MKSTEIIIEIAQAHEGSLGILHSYIDAVADTGADTIKFQMHIAEAESSIYEPFRVKFSYEDETRFDYWKRMEFSFDQWQGIYEHCEKRGLNFLCSPFSIEAVEWMEKLGSKRYKIASGEIENYLMLEKIAKTKKPVLLSSGMSNFSEICNAIDFFKPYNNSLALFQCTTSYPTRAEDLGLNVIEEMLKRFDLPIGLSDHSGEIYGPLAAVSVGASLIEVHAVFDKKMFGPDATSSLTFNQITELVKGIRFIDAAKNNPIDKNTNEKYHSIKTMFGKSLSVRENLSEGEIITIHNLESKKPGDKGIPANKYSNVIGRKLKRNLKKGDFLNDNDLAN